MVNADGAGRRVLTDGHYDNYPAWSPDGAKIVYKGGKGGSADDPVLYVMNADGSGRTPIGPGLLPDWQPCQSGANCRLTGGTAGPATELVGSVQSRQFILLAKDGGRVSTLKAGSYADTVLDRGGNCNFHLLGPRVDKATGIRFVGTVKWHPTLPPGRYSYRSDADPRRLQGSFRVVS